MSDKHIKIEQEICEEIVQWIKDQSAKSYKPENKDIEDRIIFEIKKAAYLEDDWKVEFAKQRILAKLVESSDYIKEDTGFDLFALQTGLFLKIIGIALFVIAMILYLYNEMRLKL